MVKQREPLQPTQASSQPSTMAPESDDSMGKWIYDDPSELWRPTPKSTAPSGSTGPLPNHSQRPTHNIVHDLTSSSPEFGKTSPLRNPLRKDHSNIFNVPKPGKARPEHHRFTAPNGGFRPPATLNMGSQTNPPYRMPISLPQGPSQAPPVPAASRPMFSSMSPPSGFQIGSSSQPPRATVDLTNDEEDDNFDPSAALRNVQFGESDPYMYVDVEKANTNMKALLEGAFEDDEDQPKLVLKKRKKVESQEDKAAKSLAERLAALDVKEESKDNKPEEEEEEVDDSTVDGLKVRLLPHQVDGLAWMTDKEIGKRKKNGLLPKGGILADDMGLGKTIQAVALILTNPRPTDAEIEADKKLKMSTKMGKGTLVVAPLALIRQWESEITTKVAASHSLKVLVHHGTNRTKRAADLMKYDVVITTYQILASEHAGSSDGPGGPKLGCFGVYWYRIMLDEAHTVKNRNAKSTQACYALQSHYRWCLTGTPMQNNLDELQSLIKFLRIKPYCDLGPWKEQITNPMKNGRGGLAIKRLQYFLKACMKRRTKDILKQEGALNPGGKPNEGEASKSSTGFKIVERHVEDVVVEFNSRERAFYDNLSSRAQFNLEQMMKKEKINNMGALVLLLRLRQACNHPKLITASAKKDSDALEGPIIQQAARSPRKGESVGDDADDLANLLGGLSVESKKCDSCGTPLESYEISKGAVRCDACEMDKQDFEEELGIVGVIDKQKKHKKSKEKARPVPAPSKPVRRRPIITDSDDDDDSDEGEGEWIVADGQRNIPHLGKAGGTDDEDAEGGGETLGSIDSVTDNEDDDEDSSSDESSSSDDGQNDQKSHFRKTYVNNPLASTKIRHLLRILGDETPNHKVIVFSQFTSMLDLIEPFLRQSGFIFTRYDGKMRNDAREASLDKLRNDAKTRVLLCSLQCGSLGLNLTAASRVVILEPFWNPFVEEQAIDRVHRLNQTVDVRVYKITIADSVEERILELQESKRRLAAAAIEQGGGKGLNKLSMQDIMNLFKRDAELHHKDDPTDAAWSGTHARVLTSPVKAGKEDYVPNAGRKAARQVSGRREDPVWGRR